MSTSLDRYVNFVEQELFKFRHHIDFSNSPRLKIYNISSDLDTDLDNQERLKKIESGKFIMISFSQCLETDKPFLHIGFKSIDGQIIEKEIKISELLRLECDHYGECYGVKKLQDITGDEFRVGYSRDNAMEQYADDKRSHKSAKERSIFYCLPKVISHKINEIYSEGEAKKSDIVSALCECLSDIMYGLSQKEAKKLYGIILNRICLYEELQRRSGNDSIKD